MYVRQTLPLPLHNMFEHLELNIEQCLQGTPDKMRNAIRICEACKKLNRCDYNTESRYFRCPNRDLIDQIVDTGCFRQLD